MPATSLWSRRSSRVEVVARGGVTARWGRRMLAALVSVATAGAGLLLAAPPASAAPVTPVGSVVVASATPLGQHHRAPGHRYPKPHPVVKGWVSGVVTAGGARVARAHVEVLDAQTGAVLRSTQTDRWGRFGVQVRAGKVVVHAAAPGWADTYLGGSTSRDGAKVLTVRRCHPVRVALELLPATASISGQVLGWFDPLGQVTVTVYDAASGAPLATTVSDGDGYYRFDGLRPGEVKVGAAKEHWLSSFADGASTLAAARVFTLLPGQELRQTWDPMALYLDLSPEAVVTGTVLGLRDDPQSPWDDPLADVTVTLLDPTTGAEIATATTDAVGSFRFDMLRGGSYTVRADKEGWLRAYLGGATDLAAAQRFDMVGTDVYDASLTLMAEPAIVGQVLGNFDPLGGATVSVYDAASGAVLAQTVADGDGYYRIEGLAPGLVKVGATREGWLSGWADFSPTLDGARVFTLEPGRTLAQTWDPMALYLDLVREPGS